jgi:hypothetical protein
MIKPDTRESAHESFNATYHGVQQTKSRETFLFFASLAVAAECRWDTDESPSVLICRLDIDTKALRMCWEKRKLVCGIPDIDTV